MPRLLLGVVGTPLPAPAGRRVQLDTTDPWVRLQLELLRRAEAAGDAQRAAFYRALLGGTAL